MKGQGKRERAKGEGHSALGEGDRICVLRWRKCERSKCVSVLRLLRSECKKVKSVCV